MKKKEYVAVHDCDTDEGLVTCWSLEINHPQYGKYVWITAMLDYDEKTILHYNVEVYFVDNIHTLVSCKTMTSAKRWISRNLL